MGVFASSDIAALVNLSTSDTGSLADYAQQELTAERVQQRLLSQAEVAANTAATVKAEADQAIAKHDDATTKELAAREELDTANRERSAAREVAKRAQQRVDVRQVQLRDARQNQRVAKSAFTRSVATACEAAAKARLQAPLPPVAAGNSAKLVWAALKDQGLTDEAAAGVLGNLQQESNIDPTTVQNGGPGMGLAQWSRGGRWDTGPNSLLVYASTQGLDPWAAKTQTDFMIWEMDRAWGGFDLAVFKAMTDVAAATVYFHDVFERSADSAAFVATIRVGFAQGWYAELAGQPVASKPELAPALANVTCPKATGIS